MSKYGLDPEALRAAADLAPEKKTAEPSRLSLLDELGTSVGNQAKVVYNAGVQVYDAVGGKVQEAKLADQQEAPTLSARWFMQQGGNLAITLPLLLLSHKAVTGATEFLAASAMDTAPAAAAKWWQLGPNALSMTRMTLTGALYEGAAKPSSDSSLLWGRGKAAAEGGVSFLGMTLAARGTGRLFAEGAEDMAASLGTRFTSAAMPGLAGGFTMGAIHSQAKSILDTGRAAGLGTTLDAGGRGALLGTALSSLSLLPDAVAPRAMAQDMGAYYPKAARSETSTGDSTGTSTEANASPVVAARPAELLANKVESRTETQSIGARPPSPEIDVLFGLKRDANLSAADRVSTLGKAGNDIADAERLSKSSEHGQAVVKYHEGLRGLVKVRGTEHASVSDALGNMARSDMFLGNTSRAITSMSSALRINRAIFGEGSSKVADNYDQVSAIYQRSGDYGQAAQALENSLAAKESAFSQGKLSEAENAAHVINVRNAMGRIAHLYEQSGNGAKAVEVRQNIPPEPIEVPKEH